MEIISRRAFSIEFSNITDRWDVAHFRSINWKWPEKYIQPLGTALKRVKSVVTIDLINTPIIEKISFSGILSILEIEKRNKYKGRLFKAESGQLIYSKIRLKQGAFCIIPGSIPWVAVSSEYPVYAVNQKIADSIYLDLVLRSTPFKHYLQGLAHGGSTKTRIHPDEFEKITVPIPPLPVQRKIVEYWKKAKKQCISAEYAVLELIKELNDLLEKKTCSFNKASRSKVFVVNFADTRQWDIKSGRAAAFISANPDFVKLGDCTEECTEKIKPWDKPEKEWPVYGVNNKEGVELSTKQLGEKFNAPYKIIKENWFFHNPTRANVGSLGKVSEVPEDAVTSPEYQVWRLTDKFLPEFMELILKTEYFLSLVAFNRVGGVKQRMYYANLAEIRLPLIPRNIQMKFAEKNIRTQRNISIANDLLRRRKKKIEQMILGTRPV